MLLSNYYAAFAYALTGNSTDFPIVLTTGSNHTGLFTYGDALNLRQATSSVGSSYANNTVVFGNGNTPVSLSDYKLSGTLLKVSGSTTRTFTKDATGGTLTVVCTITNTSGAEYTIKEVGICANIRSGYGSYALVERSLLDTPLTLSANEVGQVAYTIRMDYPT